MGVVPLMWERLFLEILEEGVGGGGVEEGRGVVEETAGEGSNSRPALEVERMAITCSAMRTTC